MTTYIALDTLSITMCPSSGIVRCSTLTPELVKGRLGKVEAVHVTTPNIHIANGVRQRYGIDLPRGGVSPESVALQPGDELFSALPGSLQFVRWRVPVRVDLHAPVGIPQCVFNEIIDDMHSIALWLRGGRLKSYDEIMEDLRSEITELKGAEVPVDAWLESADIFYKSCCLFMADNGKHGFFMDSDDEEAYQARTAMFNAEIFASTDLHAIIDVALAKYGRRANGEIFDLAVERELAKPFIRR